MANAMIPAGFAAGQLSTKFANAPVENLGEGIRSGFGIIGYKGKVWSTKFQGVEKPLMRDDGDGARASIEVIILKASPSIAKIYYEAGYVEGSVAPPDCWSTNGVTPDGAASKKQSTTCAGCPKNAWGSKVTEAGKQTKACSDSKRLAVVPLQDIANEAMGGPMLLRVPPASLKDIKTYGDELQAYGFPYYAVGTRIAFDIAEAYPKFVLSAIRPLSDEDAEKVLKLRDDPRVANILNESVEIVHHEPEAAVVPSSPFEQKTPTPAANTTVSTPTAAQAQAAAPAPMATASTPEAEAPKRTRRTKAEMQAAAAALAAQRAGGTPAAAPMAPQATIAPVTPAAEPAAPAAFDAMLDSLLPT